MIKTDFKITPSDDECRQIIGKKFDRIMKSDRNRKLYEKAKKEIVTVVKPAVGWERFKIEEIHYNKILLENGVKIGGGPVSSVVQGAEELIIALCTIGQDLECKVKKYMQNNKMFLGIIMDGLGSWAVDSIKRQFIDWIKKELHSKEFFRTSVTLSPGESDWGMQDQKIIFKLLKDEAAKMNVRLKDSLMMIPLKSLTFIMGIGKNKLGKESGTNCEFCSLKEKCRFRNRRIE
ncbi:MAG: hypothetical protein GF364_01705 [Candidatus Lokiarchaeota archaeon]|nr:hypothetical protein [Candidatus Lokiarchaeota archaeon]